MCIVSRSNNYIFFHIPKCGGTSISEILPNKEKVKLIQHTHLDYTSTKFTFEKNNELNFFNNSKKFAIVRNPFDRVISLYCYIKQHTDHHLHNRLINHDFTQFCYFLRNVGDDSITSCYEHLCDDNGFIDDSMKIYKLEEINNNIEEISDIIGEKINEIPHINKSDFFYKTTIESDLLIKDIFIKDLNIFYEELL
jgi:hypothetical protein